MSVTPRELEELVAWARAGPRRITVKFKGYRFMVAIGRFVEALDASGRRVPWQAAFGSRPPHDVLSSLPIERITVEERGSAETFTSIGELLKKAGVRR